MATIPIFIASSAELLQDRKDLREFLSRQNDRLQKKDMYLELVQWENLSDAVSQTRSQDEYNKKLKECQIVIFLFFTKAGKYTREEFDTALQQFKETGSPLIYTYFKSGAPDPDPNDQLALDLAAFKEHLSEIGHFYAVYDNIDQLITKFRFQLDIIEDNRIDTITKANFGYLVGQAGHDKSLPAKLAIKLEGEGNGWIQSLRLELVENQLVSVGSQPPEVVQNYGWLVETFLMKMLGDAGQGKNLRRLSFMAEAWQATLRYLCYIQMAQLLQLENKPKLSIVSDFIQMEGNKFLDFDYTSLLLTVTDTLGENGFMKEINKFVEKLTNTEHVLYGTALYLDDQRRRLIANSIPEDDNLPGLLDEYLTALVFWLRQVSFLAKYRLVSINEISLDYRLGTARYFLHKYGELHGLFSEGDSSSDNNFGTQRYIEGSYTYSKSVLLFRGHNLSSGMDKIQDQNAYLSLSPLIIDQSVYMKPLKQTPEIVYYTGYEKAKRQYNYSLYKNELAFGGKGDLVTNQYLKVLTENSDQPHLNKLYELLEEIFKPLKNKQA